jgi:soluble P-type ATPase
MTHGITVVPPGFGKLHITELLLDYTGTLSRDGALIPGVAERLTALARSVNITVLTADTFGTAADQLKDLPLDMHIIGSGRDKEVFLSRLEAENVAAIGNGRNDAGMVRMAGLGVAIIGPEGCAGELVAAADIVCRDICDALDLLAAPLRIKATLRD